MAELASTLPSAMAAPPALRMHDVTAGYGETTVLRGVSLELPRGSAGALVGPNGAGKTTTLGVLSGLVAPTSGLVALDGRDVTRTPPHERQHLGLCHVPEGRGTFPSLTTRENLVLVAPRGQEHEAISMAVEAFPSLGRRLDQPAGSMSGGERQMLAVARAYVSSPDVILLDEVSLGLAPIVIEGIYEFLHDLKERGATMLIVEQFVERAFDLADVAWVMTKGSISPATSPDDLDADALAAMYLG